MSTRPKTNPVADFLDVRRYTREEIFADPCPVPERPGVHGWWFRAIPGGVDVSGCEQRDGLTLLYVGVSPTRPPVSGKPPISQDLRKRILYHFGAGNADAEGSTLRKTLGVLLADELGLQLRRVGSGKRRTFARGEAELNRWMAENVVVSWVARQEPWFLEEKLVAALDVPFNIQGNETNTFYPELKRLRRNAVVKSNKLRILAEW